MVKAKEQQLYSIILRVSIAWRRWPNAEVSVIPNIKLRGGQTKAVISHHIVACKMNIKKKIFGGGKGPLKPPWAILKIWRFIFMIKFIVIPAKKTSAPKKSQKLACKRTFSDASNEATNPNRTKLKINPQKEPAPQASPDIFFSSDDSMIHF